MGFLKVDRWPHSEARGASLKWLTKFVEHFHLCSPTVSPAHMLPPSADIYHLGPPPPSALYLPPPTWDLRERWMGSFTRLSLRVVFFTAAKASQSSSVRPARWHKGYIWSTHCKTPSMETHAHNRRPCCVRARVCVRNERPDRETRRWPLVSEPRGPDKAAQLCPTDAPILRFFFFTFCTVCTGSEI